MVDSVKGGREVKESQECSVATINSVEVGENFGDGRFGGEASTKARLLWGKKVVLSEQGDKLSSNKALEELGENRINSNSNSNKNT